MRQITTIITKLLVLIIAAGIFTLGLISNTNLVYGYVEITSPTKGQQIPAGSILNVTGTSTTANATDHCVVSVIINGIRPYQKAIPTGSGNGTEDYTSWKFIDIPSYTTIKSGQNKITAKYSCMHNSDSSNTQPNFVKYHSVNVTGI
jgi:hypothetical protein